MVESSGCVGFVCELLGERFQTFLRIVVPSSSWVKHSILIFLGLIDPEDKGTVLHWNMGS